MPRSARLVVHGEATVYHVMSRTALDGFVLGDVEKGFLFSLLKRLSGVYFAELLGFCIMGNHFHALVRMHPGDRFPDEEIQRRFAAYYGEGSGRELLPDQIPFWRTKWASLSEFMREIKQGFSRFYNKRHGRRGFFWSERFRSVIVENGETLVNCLAYIDLNPVRAGLVARPEEYRWCSLGYHVQAGNKDGLLSLDFGLREFGNKNARARLASYRRYVHEKGGGTADGLGLEPEEGAVDRFRLRTRYFIDSGVIGSKEFVSRHYRRFQDLFSCRHAKKPKAVAGIRGMYSLKRLSELL